jgi:uncharacterized protein
MTKLWKIMPYSPPPELASVSLTDIAEMVANRQLPPVSEWSPEHSSDSFMHIDEQGRWFHKGSPINRAAMVRVFSTILRREDNGQFALVTPFERQFIRVADAPFIAVEMTSEGHGKDRRLAFRLNTDELVMAGADHLIKFRQFENMALPYLEVREGLEARIGRNIYYELINLAIEDSQAANESGDMGIWSEGIFMPFPMDQAE